MCSFLLAKYLLHFQDLRIEFIAFYLMDDFKVISILTFFFSNGNLHFFIISFGKKWPKYFILFIHEIVKLFFSYVLFRTFTLLLYRTFTLLVYRYIHWGFSLMLANWLLRTFLIVTFTCASHRALIFSLTLNWHIKRDSIFYLKKIVISLYPHLTYRDV